jgi:hypothetical protein
MKASSTESKYSFAIAFTFGHIGSSKSDLQSLCLPLRCQLNLAHRHNNGVRLTKMLTAKALKAKMLESR